MTNSADPDQLASSEANYQDLHCLLRQGTSFLARHGLRSISLEMGKLLLLVLHLRRKGRKHTFGHAQRGDSDQPSEQNLHWVHFG